jgi:hypothetical protein
MVALNSKMCFYLTLIQVFLASFSCISFFVCFAFNLCVPFVWVVCILFPSVLLAAFGEWYLK